MKRGIGLFIVALALAVVAGAHAQQVWNGTVMRIDPGAGVIMFEDGRMLQTTADTVIISGNQRVMFGTLQPGTGVTVYGSQPVVLRDGRYVVIGQAMPSPVAPAQPPPSTAVVVPPPPATVVVPPPPAATVITAPPPAVTRAPVEAGPPVYQTSGVVLRTDWDTGKITMTDGRTIHVDTDTQVLVNNQPVPIGTIKPGTPVVVRSVKPFAGADGGYAPMREVASGSVVRVERGSAIVLSDGRIIPTAPGTVVMVENRPVDVRTLTPGTYVIIYRDGSTTVSEPAASPPLYPPLYPGAGLREREMERPSD